MKQSLLHLLLALLWMPTLLAGLPEIKNLKADEKVLVEVLYTEPGVSTYKYEFSGKKVTISQDGKLLGKLDISAEDAAKIDQYLLNVKRARKASRNTLGAPKYTIQLEDSGKLLGTWTYRIDFLDPKDSPKPALSLDELRKRIP